MGFRCEQAGRYHRQRLTVALTVQKYDSAVAADCGDGNAYEHDEAQ